MSETSRLLRSDAWAHRISPLQNEAEIPRGGSVSDNPTSHSQRQLVQPEGNLREAQMLTHVEFRSDCFPPYDGEEQEINRDLWGKRLAEFLRDGLRAEGIETTEPVPEDWGWMLPTLNQDFQLWIGCGHYQEYPDGFLCFIEPHEPYIRKFVKKIDTREKVSQLQQAMDKVLAENAGIRDKRWWTFEEFNQPGGTKPAR